MLKTLACSCVPCGFCPVYAWLDWTHTYSHLMSGEVSCAECRRGRRSCSGVSCVPVFCAEIRCLSGPVTVHNIISGDAEEMTMFFHCCHLSTAPCSAGWCLLFIVPHAAQGVNHSCLLVSRLVFTASSGEISASCQDLLSPWRQFLKRVSFPPHVFFYILHWLSWQRPIKHAIFSYFKIN